MISAEKIKQAALIFVCGEGKRSSLDEVKDVLEDAWAKIKYEKLSI